MRSLGPVAALLTALALQPAHPLAQPPHVVDMAGARHILALWSDGTVTAMGLNSYGQTARPPDTSNTFQPPELVALPGKAIRVAAANFTSYALLEDGSVWAWGHGRVGELGVRLAGRDARHTPAAIGGLGNIVAIAAEGSHAMALAADGTVYGWGKLAQVLAPGQRVDIGVMQPLPIPSLHGVTRIVTTERTGLALTKTGRLLAWGVNNLGQLGLGTTSKVEPPTEVPTLREVTSMGTVTGAGVAVTADGRVWTWGHNGQAGLGNGQRADTMDPGQPTPQPVPGITDAIEVKVGPGIGRQIIVRRRAGALIGWGNSDWGQLGTGGVAFQARPMPIRLPAVTDIWTFGILSFARTTDGAMWFWGDRDAGRVLIGATGHQRSPAQMPMARLRPAP